MAKKMDTQSLIIKAIVGLVITVLAYFISNQAIQPIFSPRISDVKSQPMYLYGGPVANGNGGYDIEYFKISKLTYDIDTALFPNLPFFERSDNFSVELPGNAYLSLLRVEENPYVKVFTQESWYYSNGGNNMTNTIYLDIDTNAFKVKSTSLDVYIGQEVDLNKMSCDATLIGRNYQSTSINVCETNIPAVKIGFFRLQDNAIYAVSDYTIKNFEDEEIRSYVIEPQSGYSYCDKDTGLAVVIMLNGKQYMSIDLEPHEIRHLRVISKWEFPLSPAEQSTAINFTSFPTCGVLWKGFGNS
ncbi:hypothetical protein H0N99_04990 [Candidatus Micrarchaeota archaeon]|nr:hypothetical protein [Candidatus Micrarchaeota archaeon]